LLILAVVPTQVHVSAASGAQISVRSEFILNRYGYAVINETVTISNNSSAPITPPSIQLGLGNLSNHVAASKFVGTSYTDNLASSGGGPYTVTGQPIAAGGNASFTISVLVNGIVTRALNGSLEVLTLTSPSLNVPVLKLQEMVILPTGTAYVSTPAGFGATTIINGTYTKVLTNVTQPSALTSLRAVIRSTAHDFNPLTVYHATRTITVDASGVPMVTDTISFKNNGTASLSTLHISPLTTAKGQVTIIPPTEPRLVNRAIVTLSNGALSLSSSVPGYPASPVPPNSNYTIVYQYPLQSTYYTVSGGQVSLTIPESPPLPAFVNSYDISLNVPSGVSFVQGTPLSLTSVNPWQSATTNFAYAVGIGWALDGGVPIASIVFVLLLVGLFASRTTTTEEEETEEESSTERASDMIKAFDEKTALLNGFWPEIEGKDPNEMSREYFDELRGRLDAFRSRALQRLNEVKQKSTTQRFFDLLNQIHATEREVDRAAKDKLNLYEQFYMKRMRKDVFERLLPQYSKRLEKALNQLTDELHVVQREAKLL
jgi:hypothetical protein